MRARRVPITLLILTAITLRASGQAAHGELTGVVRDAGRSEIKSAEVRIIHLATNELTRIITGDDGTYTATGLRPGLYRVEVESAGFQRVVREGLRLTTGERIRLDFELLINGVVAEVVVRADASLLRTESSSLGQLIPHRSIVSLPLNGRNFFSLIALTPGVAAPPPTVTGPSLPRLNGGRPRVNEFLYDGISALQPEPGQVAFYPVIEAIEEFKVESNLPSAEFGRFNGGVVNLTTKSGGNRFHGAGFEFLRHESLNARNLFAPVVVTGAKPPLFRRHQFGMVIGGPIRQNRTFFFSDYQGTRQTIGRVLVSTVPTVAQRRGDFSANYGAELYLDPATLMVTIANTGRPISIIDTTGARAPARIGQIFRPTDQLAYAGNRIPANEIDPLARRLVDLYPLPTEPGAGNNFRRTANEHTVQDQYDVRIDHRLNPGGRLFGRLSVALETVLPVTPLPDGSGAIGQGTLGDQWSTGLQLVGSYQQTHGGSLASEVRGGYTRREIDRRSTRSIGSSGFTGLPIGTPFDHAPPTVTIAGIQQLGPSPNTNSLFSTDVTQLIDTLTWQRNRHSLKFGIDGRYERLTILQPPSPRGLFSFTAPFSGSRGTPNTIDELPAGVTTGSLLAGQSGHSLASFLLGQVGAFSIDLQPRRLRPRAGVLEFFAQDDLRVNSRLTLNGGLRYTLNFPSTELDDQGAIFNLRTQQLEYAGKNGTPRSARRLERLNFAPRVGLALRLSEQMVIRMGYGLVWQEQAGITTPFTLPQFPFIQTITQRSLDGVTPAFILSSGPTIRPIPLDANTGLGLGVFAVDRDLGSGYAQQWNLAIQRELTPSMAIEIAYAGSKITRVGVPDSNLNQLTAAQLALGNQLLQPEANPFFGEIPRYSSLGDPTIPKAQLLRPFPRFATVSLYRNNVGNTSYHGLLAKLEQRLAHGVTLLVSYTRSKLIDDASSVFDAAIQSGPVANSPIADTFNRRLERDVSTGDLPNVLAASSTIDINWGRGARFKKLRQGWRLAITAITQSGMPFPITQLTNFNAFAGFGVQRPNLLRSPKLPARERSTSRWFDTSAFALAPQFTLGSSSRNPVRGPGYRTADLAVIKLTALSERVNIEVRGEVFNLTNTPPLGNPNGVAGSPSFGSITSAGDPRVVQLGLKIHF